eukprot:CAMPEP_0175487144 /NCGR_PEP_ID=MMETSP0095-20121207/81388_1 /TAXON_ID=311494 /ORGANISM="Alexandrium monilatum, Strain CCMP3105" /LENGTH=171 /DNA_ID=CAMNT_0016788947 /DNA_START=115 /DNA_END=627 /DNA_ORIENTATION=+
MGASAQILDCSAFAAVKSIDRPLPPRWSTSRGHAVASSACTRSGVSGTPRHRRGERGTPTRALLSGSPESPPLAWKNASAAPAGGASRAGPADCPSRAADGGTAASGAADGSTAALGSAGGGTAASGSADGGTAASGAADGSTAALGSAGGGTAASGSADGGTAASGAADG